MPVKTGRDKAAPTKAASANAATAKAPARTPVKAQPATNPPIDTAAQGKQVGAATPAATPSAPASPIERVEVLRETGLSRAPDSAPVASLPAGIPAQVVTRSGDWVRVQVEGWVRDADLKPADTGVLADISAAEVRASPERFVGRTLDWRVQIIAVQLADELRPEMTAGQPYLLTRGPLPEPGFVYVTIPPERIAEFRALPPLHEMTLRVTLKAARTRYLATPVAELVSTPGLARAGG